MLNVNSLNALKRVFELFIEEYHDPINRPIKDTNRKQIIKNKEIDSKLILRGDFNPLSKITICI
tara:strand:+ start:16 stop:207 length:192 start_codon:yes stop_codon:yes gene_type:complete